MDNTWVQFILVLAPLLVVPLALSIDHPDSPPIQTKKRFGSLAAGALLLAHILGQGMGSGWLAVPWLLFCLDTLLRVNRLRKLRRTSLSLFWLVRLVALVYLNIGAIWAIADRFGWQPLGFDPLIVLLTAVHFHYAGFALVWIAGNALSSCRRSWEQYLISSVIFGVPLTAIGITTSQWNWSPLLETSAVLVMATGGIAVGVSYLRMALFSDKALFSRLCWMVAGLALFLGMILAILYGLRYYWPIPWLSIPWMYAIHGSLNSLGFALPALLGWHFYQTDQSVTLP